MRAPQGFQPVDALPGRSDLERQDLQVHTEQVETDRIELGVVIQGPSEQSCMLLERASHVHVLVRHCRTGVHATREIHASSASVMATRF